MLRRKFIKNVILGSFFQQRNSAQNRIKCSYFELFMSWNDYLCRRNMSDFYMGTVLTLIDTMKFFA